MKVEHKICGYVHCPGKGYHTGWRSWFLRSWSWSNSLDGENVVEVDKIVRRKATSFYCCGLRLEEDVTVSRRRCVHCGDEWDYVYKAWPGPCRCCGQMLRELTY